MAWTPHGFSGLSCREPKYGNWDALFLQKCSAIETGMKIYHFSCVGYAFLPLGVSADLQSAVKNWLNLFMLWGYVIPQPPGNNQHIDGIGELQIPQPAVCRLGDDSFWSHSYTSSSGCSLVASKQGHAFWMPGRTSYLWHRCRVHLQWYSCPFRAGAQVL